MVCTYSIRKNAAKFELWYVEYFYENNNELVVIRDFKIVENENFDTVRKLKLGYLNEGMFI